MIKRYDKNPVVTPEMVKPSNPDYEVAGVFNPGAVKYKNEVLLLLRVAETCKKEKGYAAVPVVKIEGEKGYAEIFKIKLDDPDVELKDTRGIVYKGRDYLSTMSHIRIARSKDGYNFTVEDEPFLFPADQNEVFGVEDARAVFIDGSYYIDYSAVSSNSFSTALAKTDDFKTPERMGLIFGPENKDVCIFPEKIRGKYHALVRPNNSGFGKPSIWYADSDDLLRWGNYKCLINPRDDKWEEIKIGAGAPCVKTEEGWLQIYHGKGRDQVYSLSAMLLDIDKPYKVLKRSGEPIMIPEETYEKEGFFGNCLFSNGIVEKNGKLLIYYGACDNYTCVAETSADAILRSF